MLISFFITLIIFGVMLYILNTLVPMDGKIKTIINIVAILLVLIFTLQTFGILPGAILPSGQFNTRLCALSKQYRH